MFGPPYPITMGWDTFGRIRILMLGVFKKILCWTILFSLLISCGLESQAEAQAIRSKSVATRKKKKRKLRAWPKPKALVESIEPLLEIPETAEWAKQTLTLIDLLIQCDHVGSSEKSPHLYPTSATDPAVGRIDSSGLGSRRAGLVPIDGDVGR